MSDPFKSTNLYIIKTNAAIFYLPICTPAHNIIKTHPPFPIYQYVRRHTILLKTILPPYTFIHPNCLILFNNIYQSRRPHQHTIKKKPYTRETQPMARKPTHGSRATHPQPRGSADPQPRVRLKVDGACPPTSPLHHTSTATPTPNFRKAPPNYWPPMNNF